MNDRRAAAAMAAEVAAENNEKGQRDGVVSESPCIRLPKLIKW